MRLTRAGAFDLAATASGRVFAAGAGTLRAGFGFAIFLMLFPMALGAVARRTGARRLVAEARGGALRVGAFFAGFAAFRALTGMLFVFGRVLEAALALAGLVVFVLVLALAGARLSGFRARAFACFPAAFFTFLLAMTTFSSNKTPCTRFDLCPVTDG